jgi:hypothetical protein
MLLASITSLVVRSSLSNRPATRPLNWVPAAVLRSPLHRILSDNILLFEYVGRRSGQWYATPINYRQVGETLLVSTDSPWHRNFAAGVQTTASVILHGRRHPVGVELVNDHAEAVEDLLSIVRAQPGYGRWAHVRVAADGEPSRDDAEAEITRGRRVLDLHMQTVARR